CFPKKDLGASCSRVGECTSGMCVDGFCCDAPCDGLCESCAGAQTDAPDGQCAPIKEGLDPAMECGIVPCQGFFCAGDRTCGTSNFNCMDYCFDGAQGGVLYVGSCDQGVCSHTPFPCPGNAPCNIALTGCEL